MMPDLEACWMTPVGSLLPNTQEACWLAPNLEAAGAGEEGAPGLGEGVEQQQHAAQEQRVLLERVLLLEVH